MSIEVLAPGLLTSVQGRARRALRRFGVGGAGALDADTQAIANALVGNDATMPVLEIALAGPTLRFARDACIALCGAAFDAELDGEPLAGWRPAWLRAGATLRIGGCRAGARAWLAIAGGIAVPEVLGSASTDLRGGFGGIEGRALRKGDRIDTGDASIVVERNRIASWWIDPHGLDAGPSLPIRVLPGSDATTPVDALFARAWTVAASSDRQGLRLHGEALRVANAGERLSEPVAPGTVQLPADGQPIVLLADAQTHGGFPRIGHVIRADRGRLAQLRAGDALRFAPCTPDEARRAMLQRRQQLARIVLAIASAKKGPLLKAGGVVSSLCP